MENCAREAHIMVMLCLNAACEILRCMADAVLQWSVGDTVVAEDAVVECCSRDAGSNVAWEIVLLHANTVIECCG